MAEETKKKTVDVYQLVTDRIIVELEKGTVPWKQTWTDSTPRNLVSGNPYRGINALLLGSMGFKRNLFLSFKQAKDMGASIRKGEKATPIVFWSRKEKEDPDTKDKKVISVLRYYNVFNVDQCEGIPLEKIPSLMEREHTPIEECEALVVGMRNAPRIEHAGDEAYYVPSTDSITMPPPSTFDSDAEYYGTLFHELVHSSGHESRLNRKEVTGAIAFDSEEYAIEELTAEIGATFLKAETGLPMESVENNAAYIKHWLGKLRDDKRFIMRASGQAQKAADYIRNVREIEKEVESAAIDIAEAPEREEVIQRKAAVKGISR